MLVCFNNQGTDPDNDISNTHFTPLSSEILDGVEDGDGFGFDISLGMNDAYDLLRSALSETDVEYYASNEKGSEYLDLVAAIQKYESYEELCLTEFLEYIDITADLLVDVNVSSHPEDMRVLSIVIDLQIYMEELRDFGEE